MSTARPGRSTSWSRRQFLRHGLDPLPATEGSTRAHFVPFSDFEADTANGTLPDFSFIEPCLTLGHNDYHPACGKAMGHGMNIPGIDPPSSILGGEAFLARVYEHVPGYAILDRLQRVEHELADWIAGRTGRDLRPRPAPLRGRARPRDTCGRTRLQVRSVGLSRSRHHCVALDSRRRSVQRRVPPHLAHRHAARDMELGKPFTARDAAARTFSHLFTLDTPRDPATWPDPRPRPVPQFIEDRVGLGQALSTIGKDLLAGIRGYAAQNNIEIEGLPHDADADIPAEDVVAVLRSFVGSFFPLLVKS